MPEKPFNSPPKKSGSPTLITVLVLGGVLGFSCFCCGPALLLPAIQAAREAARRASCTNNMRIIGLAMQQYAHDRGSLPPAYVADADGRPLYSWRVLLLPYLEQQELFDEFDKEKEKAWDSPENMAVRDHIVSVFYRCPTSPNDASEPLTSYVLVTGPQTLFDGDKSPSLDNIADGASQTIMLMETRDLDIHWSEPRDLTFDEVVARGFNGGGDAGAGSYHPGGMNVLFCDGSATFLSDSLDREVFRALLTPNGGEAINLP